MTHMRYWAMSHDMTVPRKIEILLTAATVAVAAAVIVLTAADVGNLRWWTFALGAGLAGVSLVASIVHELSSERVRHELEVAQTTAGDWPYRPAENERAARGAHSQRPSQLASSDKPRTRRPLATGYGRLT